MPVSPDTQFPYTKVKNFTTFSLTLSPTQIFPGYFPLPTLTQWCSPPHYPFYTLLFKLIYLGSFILISKTLQEWQLTTYGHNSANSYLYKGT